MKIQLKYTKLKTVCVKKLCFSYVNETKINVVAPFPPVGAVSAVDESFAPCVDPTSASFHRQV